MVVTILTSKKYRATVYLCRLSICFSRLRHDVLFHCCFVQKVSVLSYSLIRGEFGPLIALTSGPLPRCTVITLQHLIGSWHVLLNKVLKFLRTCRHENAWDQPCRHCGLLFATVGQGRETRGIVRSRGGCSIKGRALCGSDGQITSWASRVRVCRGSATNRSVTKGRE
jgi:hypothetical protein